VDVNCEDLVVLSPDTGAVDRNKFYASTLQKPLALIYKERDYSRVAKSANETNITDMKLLGDVRDKVVFMADDMLGTGGTLLKAMTFLKDQGAGTSSAPSPYPSFPAPPSRTSTGPTPRAVLPHHRNETPCTTRSCSRRSGSSRRTSPPSRAD
jgi:hypothetical protein